MNKQTFILESNQQISEKVAEILEEKCKHYVEKNGRVNLAISGGSLPGIMALALTGRDIDFSKWHIYFADERCVPLDHAESNYMLVMKELIDKLPLKPRVHHIDPALIKEPHKCAKAYADLLRTNIPLSSNNVPKFDICLLGIGPDGHTCSLFPNHELLAEQHDVVSAIVDSPKPPPTRVTLTFPVLNMADIVIFIATGASKKDVIPHIVGNDMSALYPASLVKCSNTVFFLDKPAASEINI